MIHLMRAELLKKVGSLYKLVNLAARRAVELTSGAQKLVDAPPGEKALNVALREIAAGKVTLKGAKEHEEK